MSEYTREMIGNCRRWIKDLTDDSVNETLCADEFAGLLDDALDEIERQQARIAELEAENDRLQAAWFVEETICPDGSLKPKVSTLLSRIAELEAAQRWIPVSERLPEYKPREFYEVACRFQEYPEVALWTGIGWVIFEGENDYYVSDSVLFWRKRQSLSDEMIAILSKKEQE